MSHFRKRIKPLFAALLLLALLVSGSLYATNVHFPTLHSVAGASDEASSLYANSVTSRENALDATLSIGSGEVGANQSITVPMTVSLGSTELSAATIDIQYDSNVLNATACTADPNNIFDFVGCNLEFAPDTVRFTALSTSGLPGELSLAQITFQAVGQFGQSSILDLTVVTFADTDGNPIATTVEDGLISIPQPTPTPTASSTPTTTPTATSTRTPTGTPPTSTPTGTPTGTPTRTAPGTPPTSTPTITGTPPTSTPTGTPTGTPAIVNSPTSSPMGTPPTSTPTVTVTVTVTGTAGSSTGTPTTTPTSTMTGTPTSTPTSTPLPTPIVQIGSGSVTFGDSITIPLEALNVLTDDLGVITIDVQYDPDVLEVTACAADPNHVFDFDDCNPNYAADRVRFTAVSAAGVSGDLLLAQITFQAIGQPAERSSQNVVIETFADPSGNPIPVGDKDGEITIGILGDVSCDGERDAIDTLFALQFVLGQRTGTNQCPLPPESLFLPGCDVNNDESCNLIDGLFIQKCVVGSPNSLCPPPTDTPTVTNTPPSEASEPNDSCDQANVIGTDGSMQIHSFDTAGDSDWVSFEVTAGTEYLIEALVPPESVADVVMELYDDCDGLLVGSYDISFSPTIRVQLVAPTSGRYYLKITNYDHTAAGPDLAYHLSVRALAESAQPGAVVIVGGRLRFADPLQGHIHRVTNDVYRSFQNRGYDDERIYYLATDLNLDADGNGQSDVDATANRQNLERAITQWAQDKVGADRLFTLYLMDHGGYDRLYLNGSTQSVAPDELDSWLSALEAAVPGVRVNVIVDACHSGSVIDPSKSLSKPGRVVIASTSPFALAYASENGAAFSDIFLQGLRRDLSLHGAFEEARAFLAVAHPDQIPWLDDDGDGSANSSSDGEEAQRRGLAYAGAFADEQWPPYIMRAEAPPQIIDGAGTIEAEVRDDQGVLSVWAEIYKPSYVPPNPEETEEMVLEKLPTIQLRDPDGNGVYRALYESFDEAGEYRIVLYAVDTDGLKARPKALQITNGDKGRWQLYLPIITR